MFNTIVCFPSFVHTKLHWKYRKNYLGFLKYDFLKKKPYIFKD